MGYSKAETEKKQRKLVSKTQRNTRKVLVILFKVILVGIIAVIIAGAGMAAHLPGMCAALFPMPVIGVPMSGKNLDGMDAL